jgi:hypothetical protein
MQKHEVDAAWLPEPFITQQAFNASSMIRG